MTTTTTRHVTEEQIDAASRWIDNNTHKVFYLVESASEPGTYYKVQWNAEYKVLQCLPHTGRACPAASQGKHCWHIDAAVAAEAEYKVECRINRDLEIDEALAARSQEEIDEQAQIEAYVRQGIDRATATRVAYAQGPCYSEQEVRQAQYLNQPNAFSLFK